MAWSKHNRDIQSYNAWGDFFSRKPAYAAPPRKDFSTLKLARVSRIIKDFKKLMK